MQRAINNRHWNFIGQSKFKWLHSIQGDTTFETKQTGIWAVWTPYHQIFPSSDDPTVSRVASCRLKD